MRAFKTPPVCTARWNNEDWGRYIAKNSIETEPETIRSSFGLWRKTNKVNEKGHALYYLKRRENNEKK